MSAHTAQSPSKDLSQESIAAALDDETKFAEVPVPIEDHFKSVNEELESPADFVDTFAQPACDDILQSAQVLTDLEVEQKATSDFEAHPNVSDQASSNCLDQVKKDQAVLSEAHDLSKASLQRSCSSKKRTYAEITKDHEPI
jgi:hypothetical protein